ncbi:MAG TPA: ATP-binding protein [bacterium]|nr:ATP-binding protein [bacterium]
MFKTKSIEKQLKPKEDKLKNDPVDIREQKEILESEKIYRRGAVSIKELISPSAYRVESSFLRLNDKFVSTVYIVTYPRFVNIGWFAPIINYSIPLDVSIYYYPVDSPKILRKLKTKVGNIEAQLSLDAEKGSPRDPQLETALSDIEQLRDNLTQGVEKFFQMGFYVTVYAENPEDLDKRLETVENIFGSKLIFTKRSLFTCKQGFNTTLPTGNDELYIVNNMNSSPASASFPFISSELTGNDGILYGINRHNNSLILFDRFSLQNANSVVFATSGAGKSYAIKLEVLRSMMMGTDIIIIDPEKEYEHLCDAVGGTYINLSLNSESKLNPFDLPRGLTKEMRAGDIIRSAIITLKGLVRLMVGNLTHLEDSIVDRALMETYAKKDITPNSDIDNIEPPLMKDLEEVLLGIQGGDDLAQRIKKYTEGTFAGLFNSPTNVNMSNQLVVFSVRDLEDELRPIAIYTIINYIWNTVRSNMKKRILIIDEAWWLMQHEDSAKFIFALVKRCRKYYLGVTTITQDVNDFLVSPYGQAIVTNSALQLLLKQSPASIDLIQKTFLLTQEEKYLLLQGKVGQGIFFAGNKHVAIQIEASYTEDQLITSDPRQLLEIEAAKKEFEELNRNKN